MSYRPLLTKFPFSKKSVGSRKRKRKKMKVHKKKKYLNYYIGRCSCNENLYDGKKRMSFVQINAQQNG